MKKGVVGVFVLALLLITVTGTATIDYEKAVQSEDPELRRSYLRFAKEYVVEELNRPKPENSIELTYKETSHERALMTINYESLTNPTQKGEKEVETEIKAYPKVFENLSEEEFISTVAHELNHARVLNREKAVTGTEIYLTSPIKTSQTNPEGNLLIPSLSWEKVMDPDSYNARKRLHDLAEPVQMEALRLVRTEILELLAVAEEIYLCNHKLDVSDEYLDSRYDAYRMHYFHLMNYLNILQADEELKEKIEIIFNKTWITENLLTEKLEDFYDTPL